MKLLETEFSIGGFRFDTLGFDSAQKSFVIIEYKKNQNHSQTFQGIGYKNILLGRKSDAVLLYNKKNKENLDVKYFRWDKTRVILISPSFTPHQKEACKSPELPIELYEINRYQNGVITLNGIGEAVSPKPGSVPDSGSKITEERLGKSKAIRRLWKELKNAIEEICKDTQYAQNEREGKCKMNRKAICYFYARKDHILVKYATKDESLIQTSEFVQKRLRKEGGFILCSVIENSHDIKKAIPFIKNVMDAKA